MKSYLIEYPRHYCELRQKQKVGWHTKFKRLFMISDHNYRSFHYLRSKGAIQLEIMRQEKSQHWYVVHPFSMMRLCWENFMVIVLLFSVLFLPFKCAFLNSYVTRVYLSKGRPVHNVEVALEIEFYLCIVWNMDLIGNVITGYYEGETGRIIMEPTKIFRKYLGRWFLIHLTCGIPVNYLTVLFYGIDYYGNLSISTFSVILAYDLYTSLRFWSYIRYFVKVMNCFIFPNLFNSLVLALIIFVWVQDWTICCSLLVSEFMCGEHCWQTGLNETESWLEAAHFFDMSLYDQYTTVLFKAIFYNWSKSTGTDEILYSWEDYMIAVVVGICGRIYWLYFLISFLEAITADHALRVKFILILAQLKDYMKQKEVPMFLKKRLKRFYLYRFQAHYFRDRSVLTRLPESLRKEIGMYTCQRLIYNTEIFQSLPRNVVTELVQRMDREMYFPHDVIIRRNTFGECMYFICSGVVSVSTDSDKEVCQLQDGDFFGEIALIIPDRRRTATVTAVTITEVYRLESSDYMRIIDLYPDVYQQLEAYALERYKMIALFEGRSEYKKDEPG